MNARNFKSDFQNLSILGVAAATALFVANTAVFAQSGGGGGCQRGGNPYGGPPPGMGAPSGFNPRGSSDGSGYGPVARTSPVTRKELLAQQKANMANFRERQAADRAVNASRQKSKPTKSSSSSSPTA